MQVLVPEKAGTTHEPLSWVPGGPVPERQPEDPKIRTKYDPAASGEGTGLPGRRTVVLGINALVEGPVRLM